MAQPFERHPCGAGGLIYAEADRLPDEGFAPGARWADVPADWICRDGSMSKAPFDMAEIDCRTPFCSPPART